MKKQFLIFATITTIVFTSCSKENIEAPQVNQPEEAATATQKSGVMAPIGLDKGLLGLYEFNGSMAEKNGKLATGQTNNEGPASYTFDRKGYRGRALKFTGAYNVSLGYIPHSTEMSVAAWVKYDSANAPLSIFVHSQSDGPKFMQGMNKFYGYNNPYGNPYVASGTLNNGWHFLVATADGVYLKSYVDGFLVGTVKSPDVDNATSAIYALGFGNVWNQHWHGAMDDVRFYSRTLSPSDVQALFNL